jgi:hypothetical protein
MFLAISYKKNIFLPSVNFELLASNAANLPSKTAVLFVVFFVH